MKQSFTVDVSEEVGATADRRTVVQLGAQLDLASSYAVPRTGRTESPRH